MDFHNFHDGHFDGIRLESDKVAVIFLRAAGRERYVLVLRGIEALTLSGVKPGNIVLDLVVRDAREVTFADVQELYDLDDGSQQIARLAESIRERRLQILELNPSYGAQGLFLFEEFEVKAMNEWMASLLRPAEQK